MEEMKNDQPDEVVEQRPSTKYGRTAYQEQLRKEQEGFAQENVTEEIPPQNPYQANMSQAYTPYQEPVKKVENTFAYVLMALVAVSALVNCAASVMTMDAFKQVQAIDVTAVFDLLAASPLFNVLSYAGDMIFWVTVVFLVLDIVALYKANYKITGAILFAVFLRPAYFIWRAHLLGQKKTAGIIYAVCYYGFCILEYIAIFLAAVELVVMLGY